MEFDNFAQNFLKKQTITADILISEAEIELQKLEGKIKALEEDAFKFKQLIKNFTIKGKSQAAEYFDYSCEFNSLDASSKNLIGKIIVLFESSKEKEIPVRFIINNISIIENHQDGLRCIQWLINKMILARNSKNYKIIKGTSWETKKDLISTGDTVSSETGIKN